MNIYIDSENHCHATNPFGAFEEVKAERVIEFFRDKCTAFIEGYYCEIMGNTTAIYPWENYDELAAAQAQYEADLAAAAAAYREGVNSI